MLCDVISKIYVSGGYYSHEINSFFFFFFKVYVAAIMSSSFLKFYVYLKR